MFGDKKKQSIAENFPFPTLNLMTHLPRLLDYSRLQKYTAVSNEESYIFTFNKKDLKMILKTNISNDLEEKMSFLKSLDLFKDL